MIRASITVASLALATTFATAPAHARWNSSGANWNGGWHSDGWNGGWHHHHSGNAWPWVGGTLLGLGVAGALLYAPPYYSPPPPVYGYGYPPPYYPPVPPPPYGYYGGWRPY